MDFLRPFTSQLLAVLRIMAGLLLLQHGTAKYLNFPVGRGNNASPFTMSGFAGVLELVGGVLIIIGLFTRPVAFILSGMLAVAYFYAHARRASSPFAMAASSPPSTASCSCIWRQPVEATGVSISGCGAAKPEKPQ